MDSPYWILIISSLLLFLVSFLTKRYKIFTIVLRVHSFLLCVFPALHYSNHEIRELNKVILAGSLLLVYIVILSVLQIGSFTEFISSVFVNLMSILSGLFGIALFIGVILLFWYIPYLIGGKPAEDNTYFESCSDAFSQGYSNIGSNEQGYRLALDRDDDGVACER